LDSYRQAYRTSSIVRDLEPVRNVKPLWSRFGTMAGLSLGGFDMWCQTLFGASPFGTLSHDKPDCAALRPAKDCKVPAYPKPDGVLSFDRLSSVYLSNLGHVEDQPIHLHLTDPTLPLSVNLPKYDEPAQRYCPAGVYEIVDDVQGRRFQINAANCLHCKACDIKDPAQNICWLPPEGGSGPNYASM
jgi:electron-transferring-flavoprotein dehydrogenase